MLRNQHPQYNHHLSTYGHPTKSGFMEIDNLWKADKWEPEKLIALYKRAGAKYFFGLANHHDNFDAYDSKHHAWNSVKVGPKKDIVGTWARIVREHGLRFGVSNHSAHAWHWFQTAYDYDPEGPLAGRRYDAFRLTKADGKGEWWEGLDPQELYAGRSLVMPDGITTIAEANRWKMTTTASGTRLRRRKIPRSSNGGLCGARISSTSTGPMSCISTIRSFRWGRPGWTLPRTITIHR